LTAKAPGTPGKANQKSTATAKAAKKNKSLKLFEVFLCAFAPLPALINVW
jgi:hypothetical protein